MYFQMFKFFPILIFTKNNRHKIKLINVKQVRKLYICINKFDFFQ